MLSFVVLDSLFFKDWRGYNEYNQGFLLGIKIGSNHANLHYFEYGGRKYIPLLISEIRINSLLYSRKLVVISITSVVVLLTISTIYSNIDIIQAYAGVTLSNDNVAKTILVRVTPSGTQEEQVYDSFSRVGFVEGPNNFLLESVPSKDKRPFYELVKKSMEDKNPGITNTRMHVSIDVYSGDGTVIQSLKYKDCKVDEYFIHGVDSKGTIFFLEEDGTVEIREVTKFSCVSFTLDLEPPKIIKQQIDDTFTSTLDEKDLKFEIIGADHYFSFAPENAKEGDLFYNSVTNTLQKFTDGEWVNISGVGGPPSPRR